MILLPPVIRFALRANDLSRRACDERGRAFDPAPVVKLFNPLPWRPVLDNQLGKSAAGIMRTDGVSWQFGRGRPGPEIS